MFRGVNTLNIDTKGRLAIPTRYRSSLQDCCASQLILTVDPARCLLLYPFPEWQEIERKLVKLPSFNKTARGLQRLLIGHASETEMDAQGRILLPPPLRDFANLEKRSVLIGQGHKFEIWDEDHWAAQRDEWLEIDSDTLLNDLPDDLQNLSI